MYTQRKAIPRRILTTIFFLVFSLPDLLFTCFLVKIGLHECGPFSSGRACIWKDDVLLPFVVMSHAAAWVAMLVMAYAWIVGVKVGRLWPIAGTALSLLSIVLFSQSIPGKVTSIIWMSAPSIGFATYLCYYHLFSKPEKQIVVRPSVPQVIDTTNAPLYRLSTFLIATVLSSFPILGTPVLIMLAIGDVITNGIKAVESVAMVFMLLSVFYSYGIMGIAWVKGKYVHRIWPTICAVSISALLVQLALSGHNSASLRPRQPVHELIGGLILFCGTGVAMAAYLCYFHLRVRDVSPGASRN